MSVYLRVDLLVTTPNKGGFCLMGVHGRNTNEGTMSKKIKTAILTLYLYFIAISNSYSQAITKDKLKGVWQADTDLVASGYGDNYKFFKNGRFEFEPSEAEGLRRILYFRGNYEIVGDTLKLSPDSIAEMVGGTPEISHIYGGNGWDMDNGTIKKRKLKKVNTTDLRISTCGTSTNLECVKIERRRYFKVK